MKACKKRLTSLVAPVSVLCSHSFTLEMRARASASVKKLSKTTTHGSRDSTWMPYCPANRSSMLSNMALSSPGRYAGSNDMPSFSRGHRMAGSRRWHALHVTGHIMIIHPGLLSQSPLSAYCVHTSGRRSTHSLGLASGGRPSALLLHATLTLALHAAMASSPNSAAHDSSSATSSWPRVASVHAANAVKPYRRNRIAADFYGLDFYEKFKCDCTNI